jgi:hypothetical protein
MIIWILNILLFLCIYYLSFKDPIGLHQNRTKRVLSFLILFPLIIVAIDFHYYILSLSLSVIVVHLYSHFLYENVSEFPSLEDHKKNWDQICAKPSTQSEDQRCKRIFQIKKELQELMK